MPIRHRGTHRYHRHLREPSEPPVYSGEFQGRKLSELSDEELLRFIRRDAMLQSKPASASFLITTLPPSCQDESQYWFAKYEPECRKPESAREASLKIGPSDTDAAIALKMASYGYRAASRKYHPDHGGNNEIMRKLNAAWEHAQKHLSQK